jgi:hypothetical protein
MSDKTITDNNNNLISINQHNYESFFLLYADGELSAADKLAVEQFVQENPGFAEELDILLQVRLTDEAPLVFDRKELLYRTEAAEISLSNYEEQFLLYTDNELDAEAREQTERFVLQHPQLQDSFTLLKKTRLEAEPILFPGKESLYRKEEKRRPVLYMRWAQMGVAAALIGFAVLLWTQVPVDKNSTQPLARLQPNTNLPAQTPANKTKEINTTTTPETKEAVTEPAEAPAIAAVNTTKTKIEELQQQPVDITVPEKTNQIAAVTEPAKTISTTDASLTTSENIHVPVQKLPGNSASIDRNDLVAVVDHNENDQPKDPIIRTVVYKELDTDDESKSLLLGSLEINKDKLRGFFRKAGNLFRSKAKAEDEKSDTRSSSNTRSFK